MKTASGLSDSSILHDAARNLLRPVIRFLMRHGLQIQELIELSKVLVVECASDEIEREGDKVTVSRLNARTGLHRRDVVRIHREGRVHAEPRGLLNRVIGLWQLSSKYKTKRGAPKILSFEEENSEFRQLVRSISNDIGPIAVLSELERAGLAERTSKGLKLVSMVYAPKSDPKAVFEMLSGDLDDLISAVEENTKETKTSGRQLHAKTEFDNIDKNDVPGIERWLYIEGSKFHKKVRLHLARYDRDTSGSGSMSSSRVRISVASFGRTQVLEE